MVFRSEISSNEDELDFELLKNEINYIKNASRRVLYKLSYKKIQKLILQDHIFKDVNIDKLLGYNVFVN